MGRTVRDVRRWMMFRDDAFRTRGLACQHTHGRHDLENHGDRAGPMRPTKSTVHTLIILVLQETQGKTYSQGFVGGIS